MHPGRSVWESCEPDKHVLILADWKSREVIRTGFGDKHSQQRTARTGKRCAEAPDEIVDAVAAGRSIQGVDRCDDHPRPGITGVTRCANAGMVHEAGSR